MLDGFDQVVLSAMMKDGSATWKIAHQSQGDIGRCRRAAHDCRFSITHRKASNAVNPKHALSTHHPVSRSLIYLLANASISDRPLPK
jgi:hypothetical protein